MHRISSSIAPFPFEVMNKKARTQERDGLFTGLCGRLSHWKLPHAALEFPVEGVEKLVDGFPLLILADV